MATPVDRLNAINSFIDSADVDDWTAELFLANHDWNVSEALGSYNETKEVYELLMPDSVYYKYRERYSTDDYYEPSHDDCDDPLVIPYSSGRAEEEETTPEDGERQEDPSFEETSIEETYSSEARSVVEQFSEITVG
ncbi:hypothetical protein QR680_011242 [Steinernema hermaphroditum]|uniref:Uncharacterized protein n=1 Tax=Steinernema hermaphroditum TaxID=289476 RepID=A0AA39IT06_9BILA|nr:hypothetical protein QR680_011242 [Steinernema hermaphroditum]